MQQTTTSRRTGGEILVDCLEREEVRHVFTVPGESFLAALDAMHANARIQTITCRNEAGAAIMAEATGKLTGRPGIALVTRGPGAANALPGVYIANEDQTPMILLVGLPPTTMRGLPAFQTIDLSGVFGSVSKACATVGRASDIPRHLDWAFQQAMSGRRGPVVLGLPEDILGEVSEAQVSNTRARDEVEPSPAALVQMKMYLAHAERPLVIAGSPAWSQDASVALIRFAERFDLPVAAAFRRQDVVDNRNACYVGHLGLPIDPQLAAGVRASDLLIVFGSCLGDISTQSFNLIKRPNPQQKLVLIADDAGASAPYEATLSIQASPLAAVRALSKMATPGKTPPWHVWRRDLRHAYELTLKRAAATGSLRFEDAVATLSERLPDNAIVTNGAGNYAAFLHRNFVYKGYPTQLAPVAGSMGYGLPAAIAAKLAYPDRPVVAVAGDGCFQMTMQELATAVQYNLAITLIIANNGTLGTIRMHQERRYPGRVTGTTLVNPDFAALAKSMGAEGFRVSSQAEFVQALPRALESRSASLIDVIFDAENIAPGKTLSQLRANAKQL